MRPEQLRNTYNHYVSVRCIIIIDESISIMGFLVAQTVKNPCASSGDWGSIPASGRSPGGGHGNPLQYSCLENPMDRGAW